MNIPSNFGAENFFSLSLIVENSIVPLQPNEISSGIQEMSKNLSFEIVFKPERSTIINDVFKPNKILWDLAMLKSNSPDSPHKNTLKKYVVSRFTFQVTKST